MKTSNLPELKTLADTLIIRDCKIKNSMCDIYKVITDKSIKDETKLVMVKQILDGCQQEMIKMVGMSTQNL